MIEVEHYLRFYWTTDYASGKAMYRQVAECRCGEWRVWADEHDRGTLRTLHRDHVNNTGETHDH